MFSVQEEVQRSFACHLIQTTSTMLVQLVQPSILPYMEQSMKLMMAHIIIFTNTMPPVLSPMLPPELQWSWFLLKLSVHLPGPGSTMATSWQRGTILLIINHHLTVLISILMLYLVLLEVQMEHYFIMLSLSAIVVSSVHRTRPTGWCPVLYAQNTTDIVTLYS